jgi:hypothetical protein
MKNDMKNIAVANDKWKRKYRVRIHGGFDAAFTNLYTAQHVRDVEARRIHAK